MKTATYGNNKYLDIQFTADINTVINGILSLNQNNNFEVSYNSDKKEFKISYTDTHNECYKVNVSFEFKQTLYDDVSLYKFVMMTDYTNETYDLSDMSSFIDFFIDAFIKDIDNKKYYYDSYLY